MRKRIGLPSEKTFNEWDMEVAKWRGEVVSTLDNIIQKLDKHIEFCDNMTNRYIPEFNKQVEILAHVCQELPDKGFCGKVSQMYNDLYPQGTEEPSLPKKVDVLWSDRRWLKGILYFLLAIGVGNFVLLIRYIIMGHI